MDSSEPEHTERARSGVPGRPRTYFLSAVVLSLLVWGIAYLSVFAERQNSFERSAGQARRLAVFFERQTLNIFRYGDAYLKMVRREFQVEGDLESVRQLMHDVPLDRSIVSHITIIDPAGVPIFNSGYRIKPESSAQDRDYFVRMRDHPGDALYVSLPHRGRNSGKLIVRLVRRIESHDGQFAGVVFAALDAESNTEFFRAMTLGPLSSATLVGADKKIRARSSYGRLGPGQDISGSRIWRELESSPVGLYRQTSVVDGVSRYYAYRKLAEFPLIVAIGVAIDDISSQVTRFWIPAYAIAALATVLIVTMTILLSRETSISRRLAASEAQIRGMRDELEERFRQRTMELERVQNDLLRSERLAVLGQLTGTVAHELRNPMSTITMTTATIERKLAGADEDLLSAAARMRRNVDRCNNIITELLDFTRSTGLDRRTTALDGWLSELLDELVLPEPVVLRRHLGAPGTTVSFDRDRIRRAVINLMDNARDAVTARSNGPRETVIEVTTRVTESRVEIEVADSGQGIPADLAERIHEPLFSTKAFGIGLGLPVVQRVMDEHGGGFRISSEEEQGTRSVIWLPLSDTSNRAGTA